MSHARACARVCASAPLRSGVCARVWEAGACPGAYLWFPRCVAVASTRCGGDRLRERGVGDRLRERCVRRVSFATSASNASARSASVGAAVACALLPCASSRSCVCGVPLPRFGDAERDASPGLRLSTGARGPMVVAEGLHVTAASQNPGRDRVRHGPWRSCLSLCLCLCRRRRSRRASWWPCRAVST